MPIVGLFKTTLRSAILVHTYCSAAFTCGKDSSQRPERSERETPAPAIGKCTVKPGRTDRARATSLSNPEISAAVPCWSPSHRQQTISPPALLSHHFFGRLHCKHNKHWLIQQSFKLRTAALTAQGTLKPLRVLPKDLERQVPLT